MAQTERASIPAAQLGLQTKLPHKRGVFSWENPWVWITPAFLILLAYSLFPLLFNLYVSLQRWSNTRRVFVWEGLGNWQTLIADPRFHNALLVTFQYTITALILQIIFGLLIALLLDAKPWGSGVLQTLIVLPMVTAPAVAGLMFRLLQHSEYGVITWLIRGSGLGIITPQEPLLGGSGQNALFSVLMVDIWQWTPFFTLIILAGLKGLSSEVLEAAEVDGANWWDRLLRIKIPLLFGVLTVGILFRLVDLFKVFDYIVIMTSGGPAGRTETLAFYSYVYTFQNIKWGFGAAIGVFIMLVGWISAWTYQRVFRVRW